MSAWRTCPAPQSFACLLCRRRRLLHHGRLDPAMLLGGQTLQSFLSSTFKREYHSRPGFPLCRKRTIFAATPGWLRLRALSSLGPPQATGSSLASKILLWAACSSALRNRSLQAVTSSCSSTLPKVRFAPAALCVVLLPTRAWPSGRRYAARRSRAPRPLGQQPLRLLSGTFHRKLPFLVPRRHSPTAYFSCLGTHHSGMIFWMCSFRTSGPHCG